MTNESKRLGGHPLFLSFLRRRATAAAGAGLTFLCFCHGSRRCPGLRRESPFPPDRPGPCGYPRLPTARRCFLQLTVIAPVFLGFFRLFPASPSFSRLQVLFRCSYRPKVLDDRRKIPGFSLPPSKCRGRWEQSSGKPFHRRECSGRGEQPKNSEPSDQRGSGGNLPQS